MCIYKIALIYAFSTKLNYTYINKEIWLFESTEKALGTTTSKHNCIGICNDNIKNTENVKNYIPGTSNFIHETLASFSIILITEKN